MSYDLYFFRKAKGFSIDEINAELKVLWDQDENESDLDDDVDDDDKPLIPEKFIDDRYEQDQFSCILLKPYLRAYPDMLEWFFQHEDEEEKAELRDILQQYMQSDSLKLPEELEDLTEEIFECSMSGGMLPLMCSYSGDVAHFARKIAEMTAAKELVERDIVIFDPQAGLVIDPHNAEEVLVGAAEEAKQGFQSLLTALTTSREYESVFSTKTLDVLRKEKSSAIVVKTLDVNGNEIQSAQLIDPGELMLIGEFIENALRLIDTFDTPEVEGMPSLEELREWCQQLGESQMPPLLPQFEKYVNMLDDSVISIAREEIDDLDDTAKKFLAHVFLSGCVMRKDEIWRPYLLVRMALGVKGGMQEDWLVDSPELAERMEIVDVALHRFIESCDSILETDMALKMEWLS